MSAARASRAAWLLQIALFAALAAGAWWLAGTAAEEMRARGIRSGFDFFTQPAGFWISEGVFEFDPAESYLKAFAAGLANTLRVALPAILAALLLGTLIGIGRLARNPLLRGLCTAYVETLRNIPLLLQLFTWYYLLTAMLPPAAEAIELLPHVFLGSGGLALPWYVDGGLSLPQRGGFAITGGAHLSPEYLALFIGLTGYTAAYIAESVRGGLQSVSAGQRQAAAALGLTPRQTLRLVTLPQALPMLVPPLANQSLNLLKNSSLAVAIGYPELVSIANTTLNQTGRAVECIAVVLAVYLLLCAVGIAIAHALEGRLRHWERA